MCPNDRGDLDYLEDEQVLVCRTCGYRYPIRDDIPVMLIDEAEKPDKKPTKKPSRRRPVTIDLDDVEALRPIDPGDMLGAVAATAASTCGPDSRPGTKRPGCRRPMASPSVVFCGMGGRRSRATCLRTLARDRLTVPVEVNRAPVLPASAVPTRS